MKYSPHPYQREATARLLANPCYGLFLDMGLGKTIVTLTAIRELIYDYCTVSRVLIIAPLRVAQDTWQAEARKWDHLQGLTFATVIGTARERLAALRQEADIYVINRENVTWLVKQYNGRLPYDMLVVDESSSFKDPQAKRFRALRKVRPCFRRVVILTGTPSPNTLMDLWAQLYLLDGGQRLGFTIGAYRAAYFRPGQTNGHVVYNYRLKGPGAEQAIYSRIGDICMSLKAGDYLHLPERIDNVVRVRMDKPARDTYDAMEREMALALQGSEVTALNAAALSNKLLQMANGAVYDDGRGVIRLHDVKLQRLREIAEANSGRPILVFYAFRHDRDIIREAFPDAVGLEDAGTVRAWNKGGIPMLLAHPASCGYGLNLQAGGNIIVWYGLTWSLEQYQQANARLYRQGQDKPVIVHHLVTEGTIDEQVMRALRTKKAGQDALLAAIKAHLRKD